MKRLVVAGVAVLGLMGAAEAQRYPPPSGIDVAIECMSNDPSTPTTNIIVFHTQGRLTIPIGTKVTIVYYRPLTRTFLGGSAVWQEVTTTYSIRHNMGSFDPEIAVANAQGYCRSAVAHFPQVNAPP